MNVLTELQNWFKSNCNDDWEHSYGVKIDTLDNPGWSVEINLIDTKWEDIIFSPIQIQRHNENDWIHCKVEENTFKGYGGSENLEEILKVFITWVCEF